MTRRNVVTPVAYGALAMLLAFASSAEGPVKPGNPIRSTPGVQTRPVSRDRMGTDQNRVIRVKKRSGYIVVSGLAQ